MTGKSSSFGRWLVAGAVAATALIGTSQLLKSWNMLAMRITGSGTNVAPSTSMELYRVNLRYQIPDEVSGIKGKLLTWELDVPRAYVIDENGTNGTIHDDEKDAETQYAIVLSGRADEAFTKFTPNTLVTNRIDGKRDFVLFMGNSPSGLKTRDLVIGDKCLQTDFALRTCTSRDYRCSVIFNIDGWVISAAVTHDLYEQPERACKMSKKFLETLTIKRDDARILASQKP